MKPHRRSITCLLGVLGLAGPLLAALPSGARAEGQPASGCGAIYDTGHYGPYDYRTERDKLVVVDKFHFAPEVEALIHGQSSYIGGDLNYVLLASPNHHRALIATVRLTEKLKSPQPQGLDYPIECYFERAIRFAPDDTVVRSLYAQFLGKRGRKAEAIQQLDAATLLAKDEAFSHYNIGLMYFEIGEYDRALTEAWRAQALGFERKDLAAMLKRQNKWRDPSPEVMASMAASAPEAEPAASAASAAASAAN